LHKHTAIASRIGLSFKSVYPSKLHAADATIADSKLRRDFDIDPRLPPTATASEERKWPAIVGLFQACSVHEVRRRRRNRGESAVTSSIDETCLGNGGHNIPSSRLDVSSKSLVEEAYKEIHEGASEPDSPSEKHTFVSLYNSVDRRKASKRLEVPLNLTE
jgi:hypothetical protein